MAKYVAFCSCGCEDGMYTLSRAAKIELSKTINVDAIINEAINQLYNDRAIDAKTKKALFISHNAPLQKAVEEGYGKPLVKIEYNSPNYDFLKQLQTNTAIFAIFKAYASMADMAALLKDATGNVRSKEEFKTEALKVDDTYRTAHLDVQYDTAVRTARLASQWAKFQKNKRLYPNLKYLLTKASKPDEKHLRFVGIVAPIDSYFWDVHYPPNRWRCQCGVEQTDEDTTDIPDNLPAVPADFAFNAGKTGQIFDIKNSEYIKSVPAKEQPALIKQATDFVNTGAAKDAPFQPVYTSKTDTAVEVHPLAFKNADYNKTFALAKDLANSKIPVNSIQILPAVNDAALRAQLQPDAKGNTNPDYRIDGKLFDAIQPTLKAAGANTIQNLISKANEQANGLVLSLKADYISKQRLYDNIYAKMHHQAYDNFEIYLKYGEEWNFYNRALFLKAYKELKKPL
jgi:hypothetical protein